MTEENPIAPNYKILPLIAVGLCIGYMISQALFLIPFTKGKPEGVTPSVFEQFLATGINAAFWIFVCIYIEPRIGLDKFKDEEKKNKITIFFIGLGLMLATMIVYGNILEILKRTLDYDPGLQNVAEQAKKLTGDNIILAVAVIAILVPTIEEILFRGYLYRALKKNGSKITAALLSAIAFSIIHIEAQVLIPLFIFGLIFSWAYEKTGSIAIPILLHGINNLWTVLVLYGQG